jgi:pyruvate kinase
VPIFAVSPHETVARRLALFRGVTPLTTELGTDPDATGELVERHLLSRGMLSPGDVIVFVSVNADLTRADANFLRIRRLGNA